MKTDLEIFTPFAKKGKNMERLNGSNSLIYTRVSTKEQERGFSLETQKRVIEETAEKMKLSVLAYFGGTFESAATDERDEFNRMLKFARQSKEKISYILVYSVDRFSRSGANAIYIASELRKENIKIFAVTQPSDTGTINGKFQQNIQFLFSEYDNDIRREKCTAGIKEMLLNGYWPTKPPLGFNQKTRKKKDKNPMQERQIVTINETGELIRKAFYWKAEEHLSNLEILKRLEKFGLKMGLQSLANIFTNTFYCGVLTHNALNGMVVEGKHPKLVSREIWLAANGVKAKNWNKGKHGKEFNQIPLKHFVRCADCNTPFAGYIVKKKNLWYYKCNKTGCKCNKSAKQLNNQFADLLSSLSIKEHYKNPVKDELMRLTALDEQTAGDSLKVLKNRVNELTKSLELLERRFVLNEISRELYDKYSEQFKRERLEVNTEIENLDFEKSNLEKRIEKYCQLLTNAAQMWESSPYHAKMEMQKLIFPNGLLYNRQNNTYLTDQISTVVKEISTVARGLRVIKKGENDFLYHYSPSVAGDGFEPTTFGL